MKEINEKKLEEILGSVNTLPSNEWKLRTRTILENLPEDSVTNSKQNRKNIYKIFFSLFSMRQKKFYLMTTALFVTAFAVAGGYLGYDNFLREEEEDSGFYLSEDEQNEIFESVLRSNSSIQLAQFSSNSNQGASADNALSSVDEDSIEAKSAESLIAPALPGGRYEEFNFHYNKTVTELGNGVEKCEAYNFDSFFQTTYESSSFSDPDTGNYIYEYTGFYEDNSLASYSLSTTTNTSSTYFDYRGGSFAVTSTYTYEPFPVYEEYQDTESSDVIEPLPIPEEETPTSIEEQIKMYFGENAQIINQIEENGEQLYVIQSSYKIDCSADFAIYQREIYVDPSTLPDTIVTNYYVNTDDFVVSFAEMYYGSASEENLINRTTTTSESRNITLSEAQGLITNDYKDIEVRDISYVYKDRTPEEITTETLTKLQDSNAKVLSISDNLFSKTVYSNIYDPLKDPNSSYLYERTFYSPSSFGQAEYDTALESLEIYKNTEIGYFSAVLDESYLNYVNISSYTSERTIEEVINDFVGSYAENRAETSVNLNVDGQAISARNISYTMNYGPVLYDKEVSISSDVNIINEGEETEELNIIAFEKDGFIYIISFNRELEQSVLGYNYEILDANIAEDISKLRELILIGNVPMSVEGSAGSTDSSM